MKKFTKYALGIVGLAIMTIGISGCTQTFCSNEERARIMYSYEPGVSQYYSKADALTITENEKTIVDPVFDGNDELYRVVYMDENGRYTNSSQLTTILNNAANNNVTLPTTEYFTTFDTEVLQLAISIYNNDVVDIDSTPIYGVRYDESGAYATLSTTDITATEVNSLLKYYGYVKFYGTDDLLWVNYEVIDANVKQHIGVEQGPSSDFYKIYQNQITTTTANLRSCIATESGEYGAYGDGGAVYIEGKSWSYAWSKGAIEGLLVYPVAWLLDTITVGMGGVSANGWIQLAALFIVTIIVRTVLLLLTFWSTISQQKMQALQPEIAKIQQKYPNSQTSQSEKQRLSQETANLYKKNNVHPFMSLLVMIIQFPFFIGVWGAMQGSAILSTGNLLNLQLSTSIWNAISNFSEGWATNAYGFWTAVVIFILMAGTQFLSMQLPQWLNKRRNAKVARLTKNPSQDQTQRTMKIVSWVMLIMIVFMGVTLPAAMAIYWIFGAIYSIAQTLIIQEVVVPKIMQRTKYKDKNKSKSKRK